MPDGGVLHAFRGKAAVAFGVGLALLGGPVAASPDWELVELRSKLADLSDDLRRDGPLRDSAVTDLVRPLNLPELSGLTSPRTDPDDRVAPARLEWIDKRIALATMSQVYGGEDTRDVMAAGREGDTEALRVSSGILTLDHLRARLTQRHLGRDVETGADVLRIPLVIGEGATLRLTEGERLLLGLEDGVFVVNLGRLEIFGAEVSADREHSDDLATFSPFIATVGSGTVHLAGATLRYLGFGYTAKFAGFSILAHPAMVPDGRNLIENSRFDDLVTVALVGIGHAEVRGNRFFDMRRNPLLVSRAPGAVIRGNLFSGDSPTNAIRVANGSDGVRLEQNVVLEGARAGLLVSSGSDHVTVSRNVIWRRNGGGVKLDEVRCGVVSSNVILDDKQKGVEIRSSKDALVDRNRIIGNANAGVWVSAQEPTDVTYVLGNLLRENGSGLSAASGGDLALEGNDLSDQFPRFLDGDITHQFRAIIADLRGEIPILLNSGGVRTASRPSRETCEL